MTAVCSLYVPPNDKQLENIRKELKEDTEKLKHYVKLFFEWLNCEPHLPKNVDKKLIENYIRLCKNDVEKAKEKFEKFIISTDKFSEYYNHGRLSESYFYPCNMHRMVVPLPRQTPEGYRIYIGRVANADVNDFDIDAALKYIYMHGNYMFHEDINAGVIGVCDFTNVGFQWLSKFDMKVFRDAVEVGLGILPSRLKAVHIINMPHFGETLFTWAKTLLTDKIKKRIVMHKQHSDLHKYISADLLPIDFDGTEKCLDELGEEWKEHLLNNEEWFKKTEVLKLAGPIPEHKQTQSMDDSVGGSFRQLSID